VLKRLKSSRGDGYIDVAVLVLCAMLVVALAVKVFPIYLEKSQLDNFTIELCREAEISGNVGTDTNERTQELEEETGLKPTISWSQTGDIQLDEEVTVTLTLNANVGLFGSFGSFPVTLTSKATGKSEVYHK
jgi:predicted component of type VI protein secretion system